MLHLHPRRIRQLIIKHMYKRAIKILIKDLSYNREDKKNFNIIFFLIKDVEYLMAGGLHKSFIEITKTDL